MEKTVNIHAAKTNLSQLIAEAEAGEKITIARSGKPVVRLVPVEPAAKTKEKPEVVVDRKPGFLKGKIKIKKGFYDPLPADMLRSMLGEDD
jgi:prevent-host-death family protein